MKRRGRKKKHRKRRRTAAGQRALETRAAGGVTLSLLVGHGANQPNTSRIAGPRARPTAAEQAHAARLFTDPQESAHELGIATPDERGRGSRRTAVDSPLADLLRVATHAVAQDLAGKPIR